ncbi:DNA-binding HxlR family transcriptional regulator [Methanococcus voltae]|uniref:winged helix-turn-helix transcriptional regulator n=1 Tax=Methanococcus voltae TaxID=2188 RepID=UPI001AE66EBE|nr:winged helix-turn-helix transcriptional regulator [Methanococcus voltae]MBP2143821.1 DNA-binding HxlR family transcriptional regulator [Methanococcus voltae]
MYLKILSKKYVKEILYSLTKSDIDYSEFKEMFPETSKSALSRLLTELTDYKLIDKIMIPDSKYQIPSKKFKITPLGLEALKIYELNEKLINQLFSEFKNKKNSEVNEKGPKTVNSYDNVNGDNVIVNNSQNSSINVKK